MSLFGGSKSTSKNTSNNAGFSDISGNLSAIQGLEVGKKGSATINLLDNGAINKSFSFAADISDKALSTVTASNSRTADTVANALEKVSEASRTETENILISLQKYALYAFLLWGGVQVVRALKS